MRKKRKRSIVFQRWRHYDLNLKKKKRLKIKNKKKRGKDEIIEIPEAFEPADKIAVFHTCAVALMIVHSYKLPIRQTNLLLQAQ